MKKIRRNKEIKELKRLKIAVIKKSNHEGEKNNENCIRFI